MSINLTPHSTLLLSPHSSLPTSLQTFLLFLLSQVFNNSTGRRSGGGGQFFIKDFLKDPGTQKQAFYDFVWFSMPFLPPMQGTNFLTQRPRASSPPQNDVISCKMEQDLISNCPQSTSELFLAPPNDEKIVFRLGSNWCPKVQNVDFLLQMARTIENQQKLIGNQQN